MANGVDLSTAIANFQNAIYGEEVRGSLVEVAEAVQAAINAQVIELGDIFNDPQSGTGADARQVGRYALLHRGVIDFDEINPLGVDLDDYAEFGVWYITSAAATHSGYVTHLPDGVSSACQLVAIGRSGYSIVIQLCLTTNNEGFMRRRTSSGWGIWQEIATEKNSVIARGRLSSTDDIDTFTDPGMWTKYADTSMGAYDAANSYESGSYCYRVVDDIYVYYQCISDTSGDWDASKWEELQVSPYHPTNWPEDLPSSGRLICFSKAGVTAAAIQILVSGNESQCRYRYRATSGWLSWRSVLNDSDLNTINSTFDKSVVYRGNIALNDDIDTYLAPGMWRLIRSSYYDSDTQKYVYPSNWPFQQAALGQLIVFSNNTSGAACKVQLAFNNNSDPRFAFRFGMTNGADGSLRWRKWQEIVINNAIEQKGTTYCGRTPYVNGMTNAVSDVNEMLTVARSYYDARYDVDSSKIPAAYSTSVAYVKGDHCTYNGQYYTCTKTTSGTWDSSKWKEDPKIVHCLQYGGEAAGKISCSIYQRLVMKAVPYADSIYTPTSDYEPEEDDEESEDEGETEPDVDPDAEDEDYFDTTVGEYGWAVYPERSYLPLFYSDTPYYYPKGSRYVQTASMLANWMSIQGLRLTVSDDLSNLEPGDFLFYAHMDPDNPSKWYRHDNRYYAINHIALTAEKIPIADAAAYIRAEDAAGRYIDDFYDDTGALDLSPLNGYPYPYVHITLEVVGDADPTKSGNPYCVHRKFVERSWHDKQLIEDAKAGNIDQYDTSRNYDEGDVCVYDGQVYICNDRISGGAWNADDWTNVSVRASIANNLYTMTMVCRPDLGHMTSELEQRVTALEEALANLQV